MRFLALFIFGFAFTGLAFAATDRGSALPWASRVVERSQELQLPSRGLKVSQRVVKNSGKSVPGRKIARPTLKTPSPSH